MATIITTERLRLRTLHIGDNNDNSNNNQIDDAEFYNRLVNDPSFIDNIRDKGIRSIEAARVCIQTEHINVQEKLGFSLYLVERIEDQKPIGLCGFVKRDELDYVDVGYAFLPEFTGKGYAKEALRSLFGYAKNNLQLQHLAAITSINNTASIQLLEKVGFTFQKVIPWKNKDEVNFYLLELA